MKQSSSEIRTGDRNQNITVPADVSEQLCARTSVDTVMNKKFNTSKLLLNTWVHFAGFAVHFTKINQL